MDKLKGFVSKKGEKQKSSGADVAAIENAELKSDDRRLANLAAAFRKKAGELGLSGSVGVSIVLGFADVVELELGWGLEMTQYEEESAVIPAGDPDEKVAFDCVNTYCSVANDIKRRSLKWKIPMSVTVGLQVGVVKVEATLNVAPSAEARERDMEAILAADWGEVDIRPGNEFVILKSELVHHEGEPYNRAISKTLIGKKFDGLRDKIISSCKSMEAAGYKGSIKANLTISFPTLLTMGVKCFDLSIGIEVGMTELLAAKRLWEEDEKVRNAGQLTVKVGEGCNLPVMDFTSSDPFVVCAIEGGRKEDARQSKTISSELNPKWNETLAPMPCAQTGETLIVSLYDEDNLHSHDFIDEWIIPLDKIKLVPGQPKMLICPLKVRDEYRKETKKLDHNIGVWLTWSPAH